MNYDKLTQKKLKLDSFRPLPPTLIQNLDEWFMVELTYTSNAIEGNTLTRSETALVLEKGLTIGGKSIKEHLEVNSHANALEFVRSIANKIRSELTINDILKIHGLILKGIDDDNAGCYRNVAVRISGSKVILPNPLKVSDLMDEFIEWTTHASDMHPVNLAGEAHYRLVKIHPFIDGNGRTARLLMNLLLMMHGYPPAIIRKSDRMPYINALEKAHMGLGIEDYQRLIAKAVDRSLDIYLKASVGESDMGDVDSEHLLKIGELARIVRTTVPTIRHWTAEGLLDVAETTASGYQLYDPSMVTRCTEICRLKEKRMTLHEIKRHLNEIT